MGMFYLSSATLLFMQTKKRTKYYTSSLVVGDIAGAQQNSWTYLKINDVEFTPIYRPIDERIMWQDPHLTQWEGAHSRMLLDSLEDKHQWAEEDKANIE